MASDGALLARSTAQRCEWRTRPAAVQSEPDDAMAASPTAIASPLGSYGVDTTFEPLDGLCVELLREGGEGGDSPRPGDKVEIHYASLLGSTGSCVDSSRSKHFSKRAPFAFEIGSGQVVEGMDAGVSMLRLGDLARLYLPPALAYRHVRAGPIPPNSHLVFEVELLAIGSRRASSPLTSSQLRRLLMLPPPPSLAESAASKLVRHPAAGVASALAAAADDERRFALCDGDAEAAMAHPLASPRAAGGDGGANGVAAGAPLPVWLTRLRSAIPLPTPEGRSYLDFASAMSAALRDVSEGDAGLRLIPGSSPIRRAPYGTRWDSKTPLVLTGVREGWPALDWGWTYWERAHGEQMVLNKQRAPLFDEDQIASSPPLVAETSLREALRYARTAHLAQPRSEHPPVMYTNGWDVFEALPELWSEEIEQLPGTIDNMTSQTYRMLHERFKLNADEETIAQRARGMCKLFVGPVGAITRIHQDNHEAHAWLTNIRGRKLYVLCRPHETEKVAPRGLSGCKGGGTRYEGRLDPLDPHHQRRAREAGLELFATVLEPGETIVAPDGWWHYAVSLTPTITLMCNFYDGANLTGLRDSFYDSVGRIFDEARRSQAERKTAAADARVPPRRIEPAATYRAVHTPWVYLRASPDTEAEYVGVLPPNKEVLMGVEHDGWVRTAEPFAKGRHGWALVDGAPLGYKALLRRVD